MSSHLSLALSNGIGELFIVLTILETDLNGGTGILEWPRSPRQRYVACND